ncbi:tRNA uridine-5-carboxymethylaminomethyl(34) synthesis GTPase MnmE [Parabacteroides sp. FAFU027]|uniref:tRNA uridine-5-carboxymethylaminomethyl(34) synthesis GTPase MnmE n=1 Tax=Parabacteroides sp. FAFU027 TaxID=2922715 RepID=UPI001FAE7AC2|nr:tRNA uridine-5-carboxymethylaminomethyl(34) synthesis GTPase MnmE [Parabacteroides sp. FAFU027]
MHEETICAVSTAPGAGGVALIRVSGEEALTICDKIFRPVKQGKSVSTQKPYTLSYGSIIKNEEPIDDVLIAVFHGPNSFTGENTVEITCHGSLYIQQQILQLLIENGCRSALPGEFTQRAFMNGKMDLSQAEAVADLIASTSAATHRLAMNQMRGGFSSELENLRGRMLDFVSLVELELDFSEEDVEFADRSQLRILADEIEGIIRNLADSFSVGNAIKNGVPVAIIGETNAGKSTLLNLLLNEEKAIVSDIHGTTRDVIEDTINIGGITFRFIDTAGIRETSDVIESLGIQRTFRKLEQASVVLWMIDGTSDKEQILALAKKVLPMTEDKHLVVIFNKADLISETQKADLTALIPGQEPLFISAKNKINTDSLHQKLMEAAHIPSVGQNDVIVTNLRHYEALVKALAAIERVQNGLQMHISGDFLSQDIRECMYYLGEISGRISTDDILGSIFSKFCIGK